MEKIEEILTVIDEQKKDKEDFKKHLEEFISYWEKEAESLKNRELTENASREIFLIFKEKKLELDMCGYYSDLFKLSDYNKLHLIESKLMTSLAIAKSNYRSKHRTIWERLADNFGIKFNLGH